VTDLSCEDNLKLY